MNIVKEIIALNLPEKEQEKLQTRANSIARKYGMGRATSVIFGDEEKVTESLAYGYRKNTTGEYVPNAYRANFGWKNTYYQSAQCTVQLSI